MKEEEKSKQFILGIFLKCPFYKSVQSLSIILALITLGTVGIYFLNLWAAAGYLIYSILSYFLLMPFTMCKFCYFKVNENTVDKWRETYLEKHVGQKNWVIFMVIVWFLPIVLIVISFFLDFSIYALIILIGFIVMLVGNYFYMLRVKCPTCAIKEECHSSF
jgi:hypothetical protein